jgi:hypothetical protein
MWSPEIHIRGLSAMKKQLLFNLWVAAVLGAFVVLRLVGSRTFQQAIWPELVTLLSGLS